MNKSVLCHRNTFKWLLLVFKMDNYEGLIERIAKSSKLKEEEVEAKVEAKRTKLSGLISKEGAAQIVAAELGISFENEKYKINELRDGMKRANVSGKITRVFPVREFNKNGREGKVSSFLIGDETSNIRVAMWDVNHIALIEKGVLKEGDVVEISAASIKNGELHLSSFADIKKSSEKMDSVKASASIEPGKLKDVKEGQSMKVRAVIVQSFEPRYFESKQREGEKGALLNMVIDDGSENIRAVMFGENIKRLLKVNDEELFSLETINPKVQELIGEEKMFSGLFRMNSFTNSIEMSVNGVEDINVDSLIKEFEGKSNYG